MICSFFGHRDTTASIYPQLIECIETLIKERKIQYFIVGDNGRFDNMVLTALRELKQKYSYIRYNIVLAYVPSEQTKYESYISEETFLPAGIESVPKRFAIPWRNRWIAKKSDIVICYVSHPWGGAAYSVEYARRQGKEIINLAV